MVGLCRLCASLRKMNALTTLTDHNHDVCHKLRECFRMEIDMEGTLPKYVCTECVQSLQTTFVFYAKVLEAQESLATLFPKLKEPSTSTSTTSTLAQSLAQVVRSSVVHNKERNLKTNLGMKRKQTVKMSYSVDSEEKFKDMGEETVDLCDISVSESDDQALQEIYEKLMKPHSNAPQIAKEVQEHENETNLFDVVVQQEILINSDEEEQHEEYEELVLKQEEEQEQEEVQYYLPEEEEEGEIFKVVLKREDVHETLSQESEQHLKHIEHEEQAEEVDDPEEMQDLVDEHVDETKNIMIISEELQYKTWIDYSWHCFICSHIADSFADLYDHAKNEHAVHSVDDLQFTCSDCRKNCSRYYMFLNHVRTHHHPALALCCDACDKRCDDFGALDAHRRSEECVAELVAIYPEVQLCVDCGKAYASHSAIQVHARAQHNTTTKSYECETCGMCFKRISNLRAHQRVHSDEKAFSCDLCERKFKHKINLNVHYFTHDKDKIFECTICNKKFKTSINLEKHRSLHTDPKKFNCSFCDKEFRTKDAKISHERTHTGEMPYACKFCERRFRFRSTLNSHTNTHGNIRPYACKECDHHFNNWSNYNKHMKRRHSAEAIAKAATRKSKSKPSSKLRKSKQTVVSYTYDDNGEMLANEVVHDQMEQSDDGDQNMFEELIREEEENS